MAVALYDNGAFTLQAKIATLACLAWCPFALYYYISPAGLNVQSSKCPFIRSQYTTVIRHCNVLEWSRLVVQCFPNTDIEVSLSLSADCAGLNGSIFVGYNIVYSGLCECKRA